MEVIIVAWIFYLAIRQAHESAKAAFKSSREAYADRAAKAHPGMTRGQQVRSALRHDAGFAAAQLRHGFPSARHGFAQGWHEARTAHAQAHAGREKAKTEHAESLAGLIEEIRQYRERQAAAAERIRTSAADGAAGGSGEGTPEGSTSPVPGTVIQGTAEDVPGEAETRPRLCWSCFVRDGDEHAAWCATREPVWPDDTDGPTYSWGLADAANHWPAANREQAERQAQAASRDGRTHVVLEYPPGGGQSRIAAAFRDGEPFGRLPDDDWDAPLPGEDGYSGPESSGDEPDSTTTTGGTQMSDTTYGSVATDMTSEVASAETRAAEVNAARVAAEAQSQEAAEAKARALRISEDMQALDMDPATLGAIADHIDAADAADKAHQEAEEALERAHAATTRVMESAQNVQATMAQGHAGLAAAHQEAPVQAATREFYAE